MKIPEDFYKMHKFVMLAADFMFVDGNVCMIKSARKIKFVTVEHITSQKDEQLGKIINKLIKLYGRGRFIIRVILMDMQF